MDSEPNSTGMWAVLPAFLVAGMLVLATHGMGVFFVIPLGLVGLRLGRRSRWWASIGAVLAGVGFLPWVGRLLR